MRVPEYFYTDNAAYEIEFVASHQGYLAALDRLSELSDLLNAGRGEQDIQRHLCQHPYLLLGRCRTGHGTYAFREKQLGCHYRIDWAVANGNSGGLSWELIELQSPLQSPFKRDGSLSSETRAGIQQILDWRNWLADNVDYARRSRADNGLSLHGIRYNRGLVVVGRRSLYNAAPGRERYDQNRHGCKEAHNIEIVSYESFIESLRFRFETEASINLLASLNCHPS